MRKLAGIITPCQSKAAATRFMRSPPAATNVATTSTTTKARTAKGSRSASRGVGVPALRALPARHQHRGERGGGRKEEKAGADGPASRRQPEPQGEPRER